jgi:hypothetical protein
MTVGCHYDIPMSQTRVRWKMGLIADDIVSLSMVGVQFNQKTLNILHYQVAGPATGNTTKQDLDQLLLEFSGIGVPANDKLTNFFPCLPPSYTLDSLRAQKVNAGRSAYTEDVIGSPGTYATDTTACNRAASIAKRTADSGRKEVGRVQVGGIPDAASASGQLTLAYKNLLSVWAADLNGVIAFAGVSLQFFPVLYHRSVVPNFSRITSFTVQPTTRVMRRRTVGLGE